MSDFEAAVERRSLPEVAKYQDWEMPYDVEEGKRRMAKLVEMDGPVDGSGWNLTVVDRNEPETIMGDLYVGITWGGRSAEVGYTFHPDFWGKGYATEATQAILTYLFDDFGVGRVSASLHPENPRSARVLEACGFTFEGLTRQSFWVGDVCSDDMVYGLPRSDWEAWNNRPRHRPAEVQLVPLTIDNRREVAKLATHKSQEDFVSPMAGNLHDALVFSADGSPVAPWYRAIEADGEIVGFIMVSEMTETRANPYLVRLLVDRMHQRRGIGSAALDLFEQRCREQGARAIEVSWGEGPGSPAPVYLARGYEPTGEVDDGEVVAIKTLD